MVRSPSFLIKREIILILPPRCVNLRALETKFKITYYSLCMSVQTLNESFLTFIGKFFFELSNKELLFESTF